MLLQRTKGISHHLTSLSGNTLPLFCQITRFIYSQPLLPIIRIAEGVQNVAKFHEVVHVDRDLPELKSGPQLSMPEFGPPTRIVCHRRPSTWNSWGNTSRVGVGGNVSRREFWAEEAGRAAAISYEALAHSDAFRGFIRLRQVSNAAVNGERWRLLYLAAEHIGVNISALVKQLDLEGQIVIQKEGGRRVIYPQPAFLTLMGG